MELILSDNSRQPICSCQSPSRQVRQAQHHPPPRGGAIQWETGPHLQEALGTPNAHGLQPRESQVSEEGDSGKWRSAWAEEGPTESRVDSGLVLEHLGAQTGGPMGHSQ